MSDVLPPTRTPAFEARLRKRYAAERRFKAAGLGAILFSVAVLLVLLANMTINGIGGFQRAELQVPIDLSEAGISANAETLAAPDAVQSLEAQGLPAVVSFYAEEALGPEGAAEIGPNSWRQVAKELIKDPELLYREEVFHLPASGDLA